MRHEETVVYERCLELMRITKTIIDGFPRGFGFLADQLRRNTVSVGNNFAEGYYQRSRKQRRRFFEYAIQSAREASMSMDAARCFEIVGCDLVERGKGTALEIVRMVSKMS